MKFNQRKIINELITMNEPELRKISIQSDKENRSDNEIFFAFELNYKDKKGYISATYDPTRKSIIKSDMNLNFDKTAALSNYPDLLHLAEKFYTILN